MKNNKFKEIDTIFIKLKNNLLSLINNKNINQKTKSIQNNINHYLDIYLDIDKCDDFYKEINLRVVKYTEHINLFKETICEIIKKT